MVNQASAGKKCIGTARPGNNSGDCTVNGRDIDIGKITLAKLRMAKLKLKMISPFLFSHLVSAQ